MCDNASKISVVLTCNVPFRRIVSLIIPMAATEMSQSLIPTLNAYSFNLRTRSLNSVIYWLVQIPATFIYGAILDNTRFPRRVRGLMALTVGAIIVIANWGLVLGLQMKHDVNRHNPSPEWDWSDPVYGEFIVMILLAGISLAIDQMAVMWILGAFSNEPRLLARYGGFFKAMLSAGLCVAFGLESGSVSYRWVLPNFSLLTVDPDIEMDETERRQSFKAGGWSRLFPSCST